MNVATFLHDVLCGGLAAFGFGVLFNVSYRALPWCMASGALAVAVRSAALTCGLSLEAGSFFAALALGFAVFLLPSQAGISRGALHVVGCIPLIPGAFAAKAMLGLFAITTQRGASEQTLMTALGNSLHVLFTVGAIGTGLAIPTLLLQVRGQQQLRSSKTLESD